MRCCIIQIQIVIQWRNEMGHYITQTLIVTLWGNEMGWCITQTLLMTLWGSEMGHCITQTELPSGVMKWGCCTTGTLLSEFLQSKT